MAGSKDRPISDKAAAMLTMFGAWFEREGRALCVPDDIKDKHALYELTQWLLAIYAAGFKAGLEFCAGDSPCQCSPAEGKEGEQ